MPFAALWSLDFNLLVLFFFFLTRSWKVIGMHPVIITLLLLLLFCFEFLETVVVQGGTRLLCNTSMKTVNFLLDIIRFLLQCCVTPEDKPEDTLLKENVSNQCVLFYCLSSSWKMPLKYLCRHREAYCSSVCQAQLMKCCYLNT